MAQLSISFLTWRRYLQRQILPYGITLKQLFVLHQLAKNTFLYPSEIAEMLFCDRPTATVIINNLCKQQWIKRNQEESNHKHVRISLTPAGRAKIAELESTHWDESDPLATFTDEEIQQLTGLLRKFKQQVDQIDQSEKSA